MAETTSKTAKTTGKPTSKTTGKTTKPRSRTTKSYVIKPSGSKSGAGRSRSNSRTPAKRNTRRGPAKKVNRAHGVDNAQLEREIQEMELLRAGNLPVSDEDSKETSKKNKDAVVEKNIESSDEDVKNVKSDDSVEKPKDSGEEKEESTETSSSDDEKKEVKPKPAPEPLPDIKFYQEMSIPELFAMATKLEIPNIKKLKYDEVIFQIMKKRAEDNSGHNMVFVKGVLETMSDGYGFLRTRGYTISENDIYVSPSQIRRFELRTGDMVMGHARKARDSEKYAALLRVDAVNSELPFRKTRRVNFDNLIPVFPDKKINLEWGNDMSTRVVDMITPIGFGQRGLIVAPPKAGKTMLLKKIANAISRNHPDVILIMLLIDERPEEVTDIARSIEGEVVASTFDEPITQHIRVSEMVLERARRLVETGKDVVIMMDSITRLARAYNLHLPSTGQTLSGGVNPAALYKPKRFFGSARNIENGGSITILSTALVDTGSRMDEIIFEEFKGTGNMELLLDRKIFDKRIFPSIDITKSSTRKEELLIDESDLQKIWVLRKYFSSMSPADAIELLLSRMRETKDNEDFLSLLSEDSIY